MTSTAHRSFAIIGIVFVLSLCCDPTATFNLFNSSQPVKSACSDVNATCLLSAPQRRTAILHKLLYTLGLDAAPRIPDTLLQNASQRQSMLAKLPTRVFNMNADQQAKQSPNNNSSRFANDEPDRFQEAYDSSGWSSARTGTSTNPNDEMATTEKFVIVADEDPQHITKRYARLKLIENGFIFFNTTQVQSSIKSLPMAEANLWLHIRQAQNIQSPTISLKIYDLNCVSNYRPNKQQTADITAVEMPAAAAAEDSSIDDSTTSTPPTPQSNNNNTGWIQLEFKSIATNTRKGQWIKIDIKSVVERWLENPATNCGVYAFAHDTMENEYVVNKPQDDGDSLLVSVSTIAIRS